MGIESAEILIISDNLIFYGGEIVNAFCDVNVSPDQSVDLATIVANLYCHARVHWTETCYSYPLSEGDHSRSETITYEDRRFMFCLHQEIPVPNGELSPGRNTIPFLFQLPYDVVTSYEGPHGYIRYWIEILIPIATFPIKIAVLRVLQNIDTNIPQYLFPISASETKTICCCCCAQGPFTIEANTDRAAYCPEAVVRLTARLENRSEREAKPYIKLVQREIMCAKGSNRKVISTHLPLQLADPAVVQLLQPFRQGSVSWNNFPFLLPATIPSIDSPLVKVTYYIEIGFSFSRSHSLKVYLPIVIGTIPFAGNDKTVINKQVKPNSSFQAAPWSGKGGQEKGAPPNAAPFELPPNNNNVNLYTGQMPRCFSQLIAAKPIIQ